MARILSCSRFAIAIWRKKPLILVATVLLLLIICAIQLNKPKSFLSGKVDHLNANSNNGKVERLSNGKRYEYFLEKRKIVFGNSLNMPNVNDAAEGPQLIDDKYYIPRHRIVHFDLKGAPPKISYIKRLLPILKTMGATGLLMEYEDMFPYEGPLKNITAKNVYSKQDIQEMLKLAKDLNLEVIPLVQTFGHVEFALKHASFASLREVSESPQALCPSRNSSIQFIKQVITQVLELHSDAKFLHIGCDEVFQMGECHLCRVEARDSLFAKHVKRVARMAQEIRPGIRVLIWDDMLRRMSESQLLEARLGDLVEPMIWVYVEDIYRFVLEEAFEKYAAVFKTAWVASAYKGAFGETLYIPDAKRHLENNIRWLEVMAQQNRLFRAGFAGIVLTGWQRYDHFATLCELLPAAVPSLAVCLLAATHGSVDSGLFAAALSCPRQSLPISPGSLESDQHLWDRAGRCVFPGNAFFRLTYKVSALEAEMSDFLADVHSRKAWLTEYNVRRKFSLPMRLDELEQTGLRLHHDTISLMRYTVGTLEDIYDTYTIAEWLEQRLYPFVRELERIHNDTEALRAVTAWPSRPFPPLPDLHRLGIELPALDEDHNSKSTPHPPPT